MTLSLSARVAIVLAMSLSLSACSDPDAIDLGPYAGEVYNQPGPFGDVAVDAGPGADTATGADTAVAADASGCGAQGCDDNNPCTADSCEAGACVHVAASGGCDDGDPCTLADACEATACVGKAKSCGDSNPCTTDACVPATGACAHTAASAPCSDDNACTTKDVCVDKACTGTGVSCDDGNPCTNDGCDPKTGCTTSAAAGPCDDGDVCTAGEACSGGVCKGGAAKVCDDSDPCTTDSCDPAKGCLYAAASGGSCDDGDPCTTGDSCGASGCKGTASGSCGCAKDSDCASKEDGDACNGTLVCDLTTKQCSLDPKTVVSCGNGGPCATSACDKASGKCALKAFADGTACDADGDACTTGDACQSGTCKAGATATCDDKNPCTDDACNPKQGCLHTPNNAGCDADGDPCTTNDYCQKGACVPGAAKVCGDAKPCTADSCDSKTGQCVFSTSGKDGDPCDADASICTLADACAGGACKPGKALNCDDGNPCTTDSCNPLTGCTHAKNAQPCSDDDGCTVGDACTDGACKPGALKACVDGDKCTLDSCDPKTGLCKHVEIVGCSKKCSATKDCDDSNPCTTDVCDSGTCTNPANTATCDDGNVCTLNDACAGGACSAKGTLACDDGNPCTDDTCHPKAGCQAVANNAPCDADGDKCTAVDVCKDKGCTLGPKKTCDDSNACTKDSCDPKTGACSHDASPFVGDPCDADGSVCTTGDSCKAGSCAKGGALKCDDGKACTADSCDPKAGCVHTAQGGSCDDGDACTSGDSCAAGACKAGQAKVCDDGKACTTDSCDPKTGGCVATPVAGCGGFCAVDADCDDGNGCTVNTCDKGSGACKSADRTGACKDGDKCWLSGTCKAGTCSGGKKATCDDGNACTADTCDAQSGQCVFTGHSKACDDGDPCTVNDACAFAKCGPGAAKGCDDKDACTVDTCDPKAGDCVHTKAVDQPCDDGDACTTGESCQDGACKPGKLGKTLSPIGTGASGYADGKAAKFSQPWSAKAGPGGVIYVTELGNNRVRTIAPDGTVSTFAGDGVGGLVNGPKLQARFNAPADAVAGLDGEVYIADENNNVVRMVDPKGVVSTFAGKGVVGFQDGYKTVARFNSPACLAVDESGLYVTDLGNHAVRIVTVDGQVVTLAGTGQKGFKDGPGAQAQFNSPYGLDRGIGGGLYVADSGNHRIRFITATGNVLTVAGKDAGMVDGSIQVARFNVPNGLSVGVDGAVYVTERGNRRVRRVGLDGLVYTVFGDGTKATLDEPFGVAIDGAGGGWVASFTMNQVLRFRLPVVLCSDGNPCTTDTCDKKTGSCNTTTLGNGVNCGQGCFQTEICQDGACIAGTPKDCDDNNNCTGDYCVDGGCKHVSIPGCK